MPRNSNATRRNSNKSRKSKSSLKTRRSNVNLMANNLFQKMNRGELLWGNLLRNHVATSPKKNSPAVYTLANDALENFVVPDLTMRKGIWEHFPVVLEEIDDHDGTQRYAIKWHNKNLKEWRDSRSASMDEYMEYQAFAEFRLLHSLRKFPHKYRVEPPRAKNQIAVLAMVHGEEGVAHEHRPAAAAVAAAPAARAVSVPRLVRLNDIKEHFPVVWREVAGRAGTKTYEIELFGKKVREMSMAAGRDLSGDIRSQLLAALSASPSWIVLPAGGAGAAGIRIEMRVRV